MRGLSSVRASKLFDNLELNSSICSLSLLEVLQVGPSLSQHVAENRQLQVDRQVPHRGSPHGSAELLSFPSRYGQRRCSTSQPDILFLAALGGHVLSPAIPG